MRQISYNGSALRWALRRGLPASRLAITTLSTDSPKGATAMFHNPLHQANPETLNTCSTGGLLPDDPTYEVHYQDKGGALLHTTVRFSELDDTLGDLRSEEYAILDFYPTEE